MLSVSTSSFSADRDDSRTLVEHTREEAQEAARIAEADRVAAAREEAQTDSKEIPGDTYTPVEAIVIVHPNYIPSDSSILDEGIWLQSEGKEGIWLQQEGLGAIWLQKEGERGFSLQTKGTEIPGDTYIPGDSSNLERESQKLALDVGPVNANEISSSGKDDKAKPILDDKMLAQIENDVARAWEEARKKIANMSAEEVSEMKGIYTDLDLRALISKLLDDEDLTDSDNPSMNLKKQQGLKDTSLVKNVEETAEKAAEIKKIWDSYYAKSDAWWDEYYGGREAAWDIFEASPSADYFSAVVALYWDLYQSLLVAADDQYDQDIADLSSTLQDANSDADKKLDLDIAAASDAHKGHDEDTEEEEGKDDDQQSKQEMKDTANTVYIKAVSDALNAYIDGPAKAELIMKAFKSSALSDWNKNYDALMPELAISDVYMNSYMTKLEELKADLNKKQSAGRKERDEALAALES